LNCAADSGSFTALQLRKSMVLCCLKLSATPDGEKSSEAKLVLFGAIINNGVGLNTYIIKSKSGTISQLLLKVSLCTHKANKSLQRTLFSQPVFCK